MKIVTTLGLLCLMATAAHAGEPWPENVCHVLAGYEQRDIQRYGKDRVELAFARTNVLHMLRNHCGVDITAKAAGDVAASQERASASGGGGGDDVDRSTGGWIEIGPRSKPSMHCTTMSLSGGLAATDCD